MRLLMNQCYEREGALAELARTQLKDKFVKLIMPSADGKQRVEQLQDLLARAAACEVRAER